MTKHSLRLMTVLAAAGVLALVMAPSAAVAKKAKRVIIHLQGPINHSTDPGYAPFSHLCCFPSYVPTIQITAKFGGTKKSSVEVTQYGLWGPCSAGEYSGGDLKQTLTLKPKKNHAFAGANTEFGEDTMTVTGRILRNGTASGTVREVEVRPFVPDSGTAYGTCDSGTVSWTASKVSALTQQKKSSDPNLVYPAGL